MGKKTPLVTLEEVNEKQLQLLTYDQAVPATKQHVKPCSDCPWARKSLPGWLGEMTSDEWLMACHGESPMPCHVFVGAECAGAAIYRGNVHKAPRDKSLLVLPQDAKLVFATPMEFKTHHDGGDPVAALVKRRRTRKPRKT